MGNDTAIRISGLGKRYRLGQAARFTQTFRETLQGIPRFAARTLLGRARTLVKGRSGKGEWLDSETPPGSFWALRDVDMEIKQGEVVGIIGRNGAGKSTLLKILSRITTPTKGRAEIYGRVGSLLEVGTGFHSELTGRENIYLNGAILGMKKTEIDAKFDEIVSFSEVERFLDTPVKRYSSGMIVRLAFAVAAHLEPEIMIIDEVLAVGDAQFQKKCLGKMEDVSTEGRTVLFVSHNLRAVQKLCQRSVWLESGRIVRLGPTAEVVNEYLGKFSASETEKVWEEIDKAPGNDAVRLRSVRLVPCDEAGKEALTNWTTFDLEFRYWNLVPEAKLNLSLLLYNSENIVIMNSTSSTDTNWHGKSFPKGLFRSVCRIPGKLLNDGYYYIDLLVVRDTSRVVCQFRNLFTFEISEDPQSRKGSWLGKVPGVVRPVLDWETECAERDGV